MTSPPAQRLRGPKAIPRVAFSITDQDASVALMPDEVLRYRRYRAMAGMR